MSAEEAEARALELVRARLGALLSAKVQLDEFGRLLEVERCRLEKRIATMLRIDVARVAVDFDLATHSLSFRVAGIVWAEPLLNGEQQ